MKWWKRKLCCSWCLFSSMSITGGTSRSDVLSHRIFTSKFHSSMHNFHTLRRKILQFLWRKFQSVTDSIIMSFPYSSYFFEQFKEKCQKVVYFRKKAAKDVYFSLLGSSHIFASSCGSDGGQFEQQRKNVMKKAYHMLCKRTNDNHFDTKWRKTALYSEFNAEASITNQALDESKAQGDHLFRSDAARAAYKRFCKISIAEDNKASVNSIIWLDAVLTDAIN